MNAIEITIICLASVIILAILIWFILSLVGKKKNKNNVNETIVNDGVRYTKSDEVFDENGKTQVTLNKGDVLLERGKEYRVSKNGLILPGKYTVLSADSNRDFMNLRIGGIVREYKHFSSIVLTEGDVISAVSANAVLR